MTFLSNPKTSFALTSAPPTEENAPQRVLFVGQQVQDTSTEGSLITNIGNNGEENALFGRKSMLATMVREFKRINKVSQVDAIPLNDKAGESKASGIIKFIGTASESGSFSISVISEILHTFTISASEGDTETQLGQKLADAINGDINILATAVNSTGTVSITSSFAGLEGNDGCLAVAGSIKGISVSVVKMSGGGANPDLPDFDTLLEDIRYQTVVWPASYNKDTITNFLDPRFNATNAILDGVAISSQTSTKDDAEISASGLNSPSYVLLANKLIPDAEEGAIVTNIDTVSDGGTDFAQFNFTGAVTLLPGDDVTVQNYEANPNYNGDHVVTAASTPGFQAGVKFGSNELLGSYSFDTDVEAVFDDSNKAQFNYNALSDVVLTDGDRVVLSGSVTKPSYNGTFSVNNYAANAFNAGVRYVADEPTTGTFSYPVVITSVTDNGGQAEFNFAAGPNLSNGDIVTISGFVSNPSYNGIFVISNVTATSFETGISFGTNETATFNFDTLIDSVVIDGNSNATFLFTAGPTLNNGDEVTISNFVANTTYNGTFVLSNSGVGQFTAEVKFDGNASDGVFTLTRPVTSVTSGVSNLAVFNYAESNVFAAGKNITLSGFVTNPKYNGTYAASNTTANQFTANIAFTANETIGSFVVFGTDSLLQVGGAVIEFNPVIASQDAAIRSLRLTQDQNIAQYIVGGSFTNAFGGPSLAARPYQNTPMPNLAPIRDRLGWTTSEQAELNDNSVSFIGNNRRDNQIIMGQRVTTYTATSSGDPDVTFKFLNYVDTASNVREFFWNNNKAQYAQTVLTDGDLVPGVNMANEDSIREYQIKLYNEVSSIDDNGVLYGLTVAGPDARKFFKQNLNVSVNLSLGKISIFAKIPIVTQVREIDGILEVVFDVDVNS